jgi:flagellin
VQTVSSSAPINAPYSIPIPTPPANNADFTQARVALDMWVNAPGAGNFETLPVIAQSDGTATVFPSTRQVEISTKVNALGGVDGRNIPIRQNNSTSSVAALSLQSASLTSQAGASQALDLVDAAQKRVLAQTQYYATQSRAFSVSNNFEGKLVDELNAGIGRLVDADMSKEAAKLKAAQTQQQLAVQTLAISNSLPNLVLSLFQVH